MSSSRSDAQRRADEKYESEKRDNRSCYWSIIGYPDSLPGNWLEILEDTHTKVLISPLHDSDLKENDEIKKPHCHIFLIFDSLKSPSQVKKIADALNSPLPHREDSRRGTARYLCHLDSPDKVQYDINNVIELNGADYLSEIADDEDRLDLIDEMIEFIDSKNIISFAELVRYSRKNNKRWFKTLAENSCYFIREYIKSNYWELTLSNPGGALPKNTP